MSLLYDLRFWMLLFHGPLHLSRPFRASLCERSGAAL